MLSIFAVCGTQDFINPCVKHMHTHRALLLMKHIHDRGVAILKSWIHVVNTFDITPSTCTTVRGEMCLLFLYESVGRSSFRPCSYYSYFSANAYEMNTLHDSMSRKYTSHLRKSPHIMQSAKLSSQISLLLSLPLVKSQGSRVSTGTLLGPSPSWLKAAIAHE